MRFFLSIFKGGVLLHQLRFFRGWGWTDHTKSSTPVNDEVYKNHGNTMRMIAWRLTPKWFCMKLQQELYSGESVACHRSAKTPIPLSKRYKFMMSLFQAHTHKIKQTKHRETKADQDKPQLRKCSKHSIQWMVWQLLLFKTSQILSTDLEIVFLILTPSTIGFVELVWDLVWESDCVKTATKTSSDRLQLLYSRAYLAEQTFQWNLISGKKNSSWSRENGGACLFLTLNYNCLATTV